MTEVRPPDRAEALEVLREIVRRSGHEIRNALNGIAVNVEVVRTRSRAGKGEVTEFAERGVSQTALAATLTDGLLALVTATLKDLSQKPLRRSGRARSGSRIELMLYGDPALSLVSDIKPLADRIGVIIEQGDRSVILNVSPQDSSHSKD